MKTINKFLSCLTDKNIAFELVEIELVYHKRVKFNPSSWSIYDRVYGGSPEQRDNGVHIKKVQLVPAVIVDNKTYKLKTYCPKSRSVKNIDLQRLLNKLVG